MSNCLLPPYNLTGLTRYVVLLVISGLCKYMHGCGGGGWGWGWGGVGEGGGRWGHAVAMIFNFHRPMVQSTNNKTR